jgi:hypothetical protein
MGQAKKRGSFEERQAQAIVREREKWEKQASAPQATSEQAAPSVPTQLRRYPRRTSVRGSTVKFVALAAALAGISAGTYENSGSKDKGR